MRAQYTALDTAMAQLNGQSSYITQQIAAFNDEQQRASSRRAPRQRRGAAREEHDFRAEFQPLRRFKSAGAIPILKASPTSEASPPCSLPPPSSTQRLPRLRRRLPQGRRRDRRRRGLAAPARDDAVRRLQRRDRPGPRALLRRATSRPSARRSRAPCGSSTRACKAPLDAEAGGELGRDLLGALRLRRAAPDPGQPEQRRRRARRVRDA